MAKMGKSGGMDMCKGMSRKSPAGVDKSMACKGGSVDSDTTRDKVAPTPATIGGRVA